MAPTTHFAAISALLALGTFCAPAQAAFQLNNIGTQCSGSLVTQAGDAYSLSCTGDLSLQGLAGQGSLLADSSISLSATGTLSLLDVLLQAPSITLSGVGVTVDAASKLVGSSVVVSGNTVALGGTVDTHGGNFTLLTENGQGTMGGGFGSGATLSTSGGSSGGSGVVIGGGSISILNGPDVIPPSDVTLVPEASTSSMLLAGLVGMGALVASIRAKSRQFTLG